MSSPWQNASPPEKPQMLSLERWPFTPLHPKQGCQLYKAQSDACFFFPFVQCHQALWYCQNILILIPFLMPLCALLHPAPSLKARYCLKSKHPSPPLMQRIWTGLQPVEFLAILSELSAKDDEFIHFCDDSDASRLVHSLLKLPGIFPLLHCHRCWRALVTHH